MSSSNTYYLLEILIGLVEGRVSLPNAEEQDVPLPSPTRMLKARKLLSANVHEGVLNSFGTLIDLSVPSANVVNAVETISCYGLFEYLTQGIDEACKAFDAVLDRIESPPSTFDYRGTVGHELIVTMYAKIAYFHSRAGSSFKPGTLRDILEQRALQYFPQNTIFLSLFSHNESRMKVENRLRRFLDTILRKSPSHILWTFFLYTELHSSSHTVNVNYVRSIFERASECARYTILLNLSF